MQGLKGLCQNKMKRNHTHDFFSFFPDTFPLILVFYAAFLLKNIPLLFILIVRNRSFDTVPLNHSIYCGLLLKNTFTGFSFIQENVDRRIDF
jgi:hypothetical protein